MIKNILFDLDGVLVDARDWHKNALNKALLQVAGIEIGEKEHLSDFDGLPTKAKLEMLIMDGRITRDHVKPIWNLKQHYTMNFIKACCRPVPEKIEMMKRLSQYRRACVTNAISKTAYEMLVHSGLNYYLEYVQSNEATPFPKPSPAPYMMAMAKMNMSPNETMVIEDNEKGATSAYLSGAYTVVLQYEDVNIERIEDAIKKANAQ